MVDACLDVCCELEEGICSRVSGSEAVLIFSWWRNLLIEGKMSALRTLAAGMGRLEVPCDESLVGLGIGMTNEIFQIYGRRQESLESDVRCSGPYILLLIQLLIALVTWSLVNDYVSYRDIPRHLTSPPR